MTERERIIRTMSPRELQDMEAIGYPLPPALKQRLAEWQHKQQIIELERQVKVTSVYDDEKRGAA